MILYFKIVSTIFLLVISACFSKQTYVCLEQFFGDKSQISDATGFLFGCIITGAAITFLVKLWI